MRGIFTALQEAAVTMHQGGGIGCDFSTLRPQGARAKGVGNVASGPVSVDAVDQEDARLRGNCGH
jgi:ribonucleoside-diphosphate reductase alpha chain